MIGWMMKQGKVRGSVHIHSLSNDIDGKNNYENLIIFFFFYYRRNAIDKANSMTSHIAYPDELLDDCKLNAYYENVINYLRPN